jgi:hypothetical protein
VDNSRLTFITLLAAFSVSADPVPVRFPEGTLHGFLSGRAEDGKLLATGDLIQITKADRIEARLTFHFKDGSVDDETTVFTQARYFKLISYRHIQKGPSFPVPSDVNVTTASGKVTVRYTEKGREQVASEHYDLPPDVANGVILQILKNIPQTAAETRVSYIANSPKPRLIKLSLSPDGEETFYNLGTPGKAVRYRVKAELGGVAGVFAPLVGKQPPDTYVWVLKGEPGEFLKMKGPLYVGGPNWTIELTSPVWK